MSYYCYMITSASANRTYIGMTNNIDDRCRQHRGELKGGAKATKGVTDWEYNIIVGEFEDKSKAMRFEWLFKHKKSSTGKWINSSGIKGRIERLNELLDEDEWGDIIVFYQKN